jgi:hypothetical protein
MSSIQHVGLCIILQLSFGVTSVDAQRTLTPGRVDDNTTLIVLGVDHSAQLVGRTYHPGYFRSFIERVHPAAICVERSPDEFARGDYYEFTYEVQHIAVPYARAHGVELCPVDWLPSRDDERHAFGRLEVVELPAVRGRRDFRGFLVMDSASLRRTLLYADSAPDREAAKRFYDRPRAAGWSDFPRRLGLYRTFMQAMRVRAALNAHPGQSVLVVIGSMHKDDIEHILAQDASLRIVQPSSYGAPSASDADARLQDTDFAAILSFNLLGVQALEGPVDWPWVGEVLERFAHRHPNAPELPLLRERYAVLTRSVPATEAAAAYERLATSTDSLAEFTFTGVEDVRRLDSYFDPFGNLGVRQRALLEAGREWSRAVQPGRAAQLRAQLTATGTWSLLRRAQLTAYWDRYITPVTKSSAARAR